MGWERCEQKERVLLQQLAQENPARPWRVGERAEQGHTAIRELGKAAIGSRRLPWDGAGISELSPSWFSPLWFLSPFSFPSEPLVRPCPCPGATGRVLSAGHPPLRAAWVLTGRTLRLQFYFSKKNLKVKESLAGFGRILTCISSELGLFQPAEGLPDIVNSAVNAQECVAQAFEWEGET